MSAFLASRRRTCSAEQLLDVLTDTQACLAWSPVPLRVEGPRVRRLRRGAQARICGSLCGRGIGFDVAVEDAGADRLALRARGPFEVHVEYRLDDERIELQVATSSPRGLGGRCLMAAGEALLAGGLLDQALSRLEAHALAEA